MAQTNETEPSATEPADHIATDLQTQLTSGLTRSADSHLPEQGDFYSAFWENVIEISRTVPTGEDPAYWPLHIMFELDDLITHRKYSAYKPKKAVFANRLAPFQDSIRNIKSAYAITAYPQATTRKDTFSIQLAHDQRVLEIDGKPRQSFQLTDAESEVLGRLCETPRHTTTDHDQDGRDTRPIKTILPKIPFDPQKRTFRYSDVPASKR